VTEKRPPRTIPDVERLADMIEPLLELLDIARLPSVPERGWARVLPVSLVEIGRPAAAARRSRPRRLMNLAYIWTSIHQTSEDKLP
jgi:hypothetical protein